MYGRKLKYTDPAANLNGEGFFYIRSTQSHALYTGKFVKERNFRRESSLSPIVTPIKFSGCVSSLVSKVGPRRSSGLRQCDSL